MQNWYDEFDKLMDKHRICRGKWVTIFRFPKNPKSSYILVPDIDLRKVNRQLIPKLFDVLSEITENRKLHHYRIADAIEEFIHIEFFMEEKYPGMIQDH